MKKPKKLTRDQVHAVAVMRSTLGAIETYSDGDHIAGLTLSAVGAALQLLGYPDDLEGEIRGLLGIEETP